MLNDAEPKGFHHIVSWLPCGSKFKVHNTQKFERDVLPRYFHNQTRYKVRLSKQSQPSCYLILNNAAQTSVSHVCFHTSLFQSFLRQLNLYCFSRNVNGDYRHDIFQRGRLDLCRHITRKKVKNSNRSRDLKNKARRRTVSADNDSVTSSNSHSSNASKRSGRPPQERAKPTTVKLSHAKKPRGRTAATHDSIVERLLTPANELASTPLMIAPDIIDVIIETFSQEKDSPIDYFELEPIPFLSS